MDAWPAGGAKCDRETPRLKHAVGRADGTMELETTICYLARHVQAEWRDDGGSEKVSMRSVAAFALASLAICHPACAARSEQAHLALSYFREALTLSLTVPANVVVGEKTRLRVRVQNSGPRAIDGCVGPSRNVWITPEDDTQGNEPLSISEHVVDHPRCQRRLRLAPGAHVEW